MCLLIDQASERHHPSTRLQHKLKRQHAHWGSVCVGVCLCVLGGKMPPLATIGSHTHRERVRKKEREKESERETQAWSTHLPRCRVSQPARARVLPRGELGHRSHLAAKGCTCCGSPRNQMRRGG